MHRKTLVVTATVAAAAIGLGACGSGSGSGSGGTGSQSITATYMQSGTYDKAAEALTGPFQTKTGVKVDVKAYPYAALEQNNTNAVISGSCDYNVISGSYYLADIYGNFRSLDSLAAKSNYASQLIPGLWAHSEFYNGQHIGLPYGPDAYGLMYRTDLFKEAGLSLPTTWPEFLSDLTVLQKKFGSQGIAPFAFAAGESEQLPALFFASYGGYFINSSGHYALDTAKAVAALQLAQKLLTFAPKDATGQSIDAANEQFTSGKAAVLYGWPSFIRQQADASNSPVAGKWAVMPDPRPGLIWLSLWQLYMTKCTPDVQAAWKWMTTYSSPATDQTLFTKYGVNPSFEQTYDNPTLAKQNANYFPAEKANLALAENPPLSGQAQDFLASTIGNMITGKTTPQQVVSAVNNQWATLTVPASLLKEGRQDGLAQQ
jgi:ABC-type glycerol-3-phosphate transport system substrate-binding protein